MSCWYYKLSSEITAQLGSNGGVPCTYGGIDGDGDADLLLRFRAQATGMAYGNAEATRTGKTFDGRAITGTDTLEAVGCR